MVAQKDFAFLVEGTLGDEAYPVALGRVLVIVQGKDAAGVENLME